MARDTSKAQQAAPKDEAAPKAAAAPASKPAPATVIYIGPTVQRHALRQFTIYRGGKPAHIDALVGQVPELHHLFVPVSGLAEARKRLAQRGSREARHFAAAANKLNEIKG
jgi:hypothetical protein